MTTRVLDPYEVLGIPPGASRDEAARAHRRLAKKFHPDVNPGPAAAERMRRINEAWRVVSNSARRARYDRDRSAASWPTHAYPGQRRAESWTSWPDARHSTGPRVRRPPRPAPVEPSFGDRRAVVFAVWMLIGLLAFFGTWLGSVSPP